MAEDATVVHITESPHSIEISRNASGGVAFSVKIYGGNPESAMARAQALIAQLESDYPPARK